MTQRRNLVRDPEAVTLLDWAASASAGTPVLTSINTTPMLTGVPTYGHSVASAICTTLGATLGAVGAVPVAAGTTYILSSYLRPHTAAIIAQTNLAIQWMNAANAVISTSTGSAVTLTQDVSTRVSFSAVAPALAVRAVLIVRAIASGGSFAAAAYVDASGVLFEAGATLNAFYDGTIGGGIWDAAANGSTSTLHLFAAPTLVGTDAPPKVQITFNAVDLSDDTDHLILYRTYSDQPGWTPVVTTARNGVNKFAAGGFTCADEEVPVGVVITYYAEIFRVDGVDIGTTPTSTVTVANTASIDDGWLSDPLVEGSAIRVTLTDLAGSNPSRPMVGAKYQVGFRTVVLNSRQSDLTDLNMGFYTGTIEELLAIQDLISSTGGLILIRCAPPRLIPRQLYCWADNASPDDFNLPAGLEDAEWANVVQQTSAVEGDVQLPAVSWQTYIDAFPTWANMDAAYTTWFDAMKNPPA